MYTYNQPFDKPIIRSLSREAFYQFASSSFYQVLLLVFTIWFQQYVIWVSIPHSTIMCWKAFLQRKKQSISCQVLVYLCKKDTQSTERIHFLVDCQSCCVELDKKSEGSVAHFLQFSFFAWKRFQGDLFHNKLGQYVCYCCEVNQLALLWLRRNTASAKLKNWLFSTLKIGSENGSNIRSMVMPLGFHLPWRQKILKVREDLTP